MEAQTRVPSQLTERSAPPHLVLHYCLHTPTGRVLTTSSHTASIKRSSLKMQDLILSSLPKGTHLILPQIFRDKYHSAHLTNKETEALEDQVGCWRSRGLRYSLGAWLQNTGS